jgi:hypothetical protein
VWSTVPSASTRLRGGFGQGWLTFECTSADAQFPLKRLVPIPPEWETASEDQLEEMRRAAEDVVRPVPSRSDHPQSAESTGRE